MKTRCGSVVHYLLNLHVPTTQLFKQSTDASRVYSTTECAATDSHLVLFVRCHNCVHILFSLVNGLKFELEEAAD